MHKLSYAITRENSESNARRGNFLATVQMSADRDTLVHAWTESGCFVTVYETDVTGKMLAWFTHSPVKA